MSEPVRRRDPGPRKAVPVERLDQPLAKRRTLVSQARMDPEVFGAFAERFARFMGTARFLVWMTIFVLVWIGWNALAPDRFTFDPYAFIFLTLMLSLQASYAAPLILLAQNRQDDRDKVQMGQDRARDERNLADTEFLTREVAALRLALREVATRDFVRSELRSLLEEMDDRAAERHLRSPEGTDRGQADGTAPDDARRPPREADEG
ncbi:DUF1003 domain-containing protein [Ornithinimicrobium avium]|uniref:DUF1003 domain-containing protein n=1 Tax=Ornithinimicrobium avium TaxID=2283195 RepID=A0A345NRI7_9MICO|nr:DUF1003 domain-containing protein [Ornithinimicrobium avium]AXH97645.1 DUF1003 domain-containing protein [Ornithinimicrobium avium]